jgi:nucleoside-diphosphate-sugar epimerase
LLLALFIFQIIANKRILVSGGAGFLGSHLSMRLLDLGYDVIALDNLYTGRMEKIKTLFESSRFSFYRHRG